MGLRDRALLSVMVYSFARVSAAVGMRRQDYFRQGVRGWLRLHEKGGKRHDVPAHHRAEEAVEAYVVAGGLEDARAPLFQSVDRSGRLSGRPLGRRAVLAMIQAAGVGRGVAGVDVLPHVSGDGHHGVPVERRDARARPADRRACVAEDDEALRPDGGHDHARRDRAHRDLVRSAGCAVPAAIHAAAISEPGDPPLRSLLRGRPRESGGTLHGGRVGLPF